MAGESYGGELTQLRQWVSPGLYLIVITWRVVRNRDAQAAPQTNQIRTSGPATQASVYF